MLIDWCLQAQLEESTVALAEGFDAVCLFVNDICGREVVQDVVIDENGVVRSTGLMRIGYDPEWHQ